MNAPSAAVCPTCKGSGHRTWAFDRTLLGGKRGKREQRCLACRGTGYVEPGRVCPACGNWNDVCTCPKSKIIKLEARMEGTRGIYWNKKNHTYQVEIRRDGKQHSLGSFDDKALAFAIRQEAEQLPTSEFPALKAKYQALRKANKNGNTYTAPAPSEDVVEAEVPDDADVLHQKLIAARKADERFQAIREQYCAAERDAIDAWNEYARELSSYGQSDTFYQSYLGFLHEEINRS